MYSVQTYLPSRDFLVLSVQSWNDIRFLPPFPSSFPGANVTSDFIFTLYFFFLRARRLRVFQKFRCPRRIRDQMERKAHLDLNGHLVSEPRTGVLMASKSVP